MESPGLSSRFERHHSRPRIRFDADRKDSDGAKSHADMKVSVLLLALGAV